MKLKLVKKKDEAPGVKTFFFEPDQKIEYKAGQYFYFTLPKLNYNDEKGDTRHFTASSSPSEELLSFTTKFTDPISGYKKTLLELPVGSIIDVRGPQGVFTPSFGLFIAGGIGITPFRSIVKYNFDKGITMPYLIYSNSDENFVFKDELATELKDRVSFINTSVLGHIDELKINELVKNWGLDIKDCDFGIVGPPKFVDAMEDALDKLNISSEKIKTEKFTGY